MVYTIPIITMMPGESISRSETSTEPAERVASYPKEDFTIDVDGVELTPILEPKVCQGKVVGYELLLRYRDTRQTYGPAIEYAEQNGTVGEVVRKTLASTRKALESLRVLALKDGALYEQGTLVPIAVNVPLQELFGETFEYLETLAEDNPELVPYLELEITEREEYREEHVAQLSVLAKLGYYIILDDFDTKYCNEETLRLFMKQAQEEREQSDQGQESVVEQGTSRGADGIEKLKNDIKQTTAIHTIKLDKYPLTKDPVVLRDMLHRLMDEYGVHVVIEGVEDADALERVAELGLPHEQHSTQGYVHGREPLSLSEYVAKCEQSVPTEASVKVANVVVH